MARAGRNAAIDKGRRGRRRGAAVVEAAIVLPLCLLLLMNIYDFARLVMTEHLLNNAARSGARLAVANTSTLTTTAIQNQVTSDLMGQSLVSMSIQVYQVNPATGASLARGTTRRWGAISPCRSRGTSNRSSRARASFPIPCQ